MASQSHHPSDTNAKYSNVNVNYASSSNTSHAHAHAPGSSSNCINAPRTLTFVRDADTETGFGGDSLLGRNANANAVMPKPSTITAYLHYHNYRIGKVIGEGSYSKVKIATRYLTNGTSSYRLAVKIINKRLASGDFVTKFLPREIDILSKISHKNIIQIYDLVEFDGNVYIFMDWCDRGDLLEQVKAHGHISENKSRYYFRQLLSAVQYLHRLDLAHRDLKCENILMKALGDQVYISDFGFARYCREKGRRVLSSTYCGSAAYASPEIIQGIPYNPKLYDLWSLGCILFVMVTGHMPYDETNVPKMLQAQQTRYLHYPPPSDKRVTDLGKGYIRRMLEPDITRRCNIDQACAHEWLETQPPSSAAGDQAATRPGSAGAGGDGGLPDKHNQPATATPQQEYQGSHSHSHREAPSSNSARISETPRGRRSNLYTPQRQTQIAAPLTVTTLALGSARTAQGHHKTGQSENPDDSGYFSASSLPPPPPPMTSRTFYNSSLRHDRDRDRDGLREREREHSHHADALVSANHNIDAHVHAQTTPISPGTPGQHQHHHHHRRSQRHAHRYGHSHLGSVSGSAGARRQ